MNRFDFLKSLAFEPPEGVPEKEKEFWNHNAPEIQIIRMEMERAGLGLWNNQRVVNLCRLYRCTIWTLCARVGAFRTSYNGQTDSISMILDTSLIKRSWRANLWPPILTAQFDRLEKYAELRANKPGATLIGSMDRIHIKHPPVNA